MPIAAASEAIRRHLQSLLGPGGDGGGVEVMTLAEARTRPGHGIALVLWRVQPDESAGDTFPQRQASKGDPPDGGGLRLRYLLTVRGQDGPAEQALLGRCMALLDANPVVGGAGDPADIMAEALVLTTEAPSDEAYLRLAEACGDPPPLVVPYLVRSVRLRPPGG
ncbi:Pvc16 family protein [Falsiroseomonas sp. CW058]|uniref:Pvc16 family protein n=1 Tax=Falsiroseomonas sp. CW058 TaxID=3388664 RepID=UPI003D313388